jgi:hypothetical protein
MGWDELRSAEAMVGLNFGTGNRRRSDERDWLWGVQSFVFVFSSRVA